MKTILNQIYKLLIASMLWLPGSLLAQQLPLNNYFQIQNSASTLVISTDANNFIIPWTSIPARNDFEWGFVKHPNYNWYQIVNKITGGCLDVNGNNQVVQTNYMAGRNQQYWIITPLGNELYTIANTSGGYLAVQPGSTKPSANGQQVVIHSSVSSSAEKWQFINPGQKIITLRVPEGSTQITVPYKNFNSITNTTYTIYGDSILVNNALTGKVSGSLTQVSSNITFNVKPLLKGSVSPFLITLTSTNAQSSGCVFQVNFNVVAVPNTVSWNPGSKDNDWNNDDNWTMVDNNLNPTSTPAKTPLPTTTVIIPGNAANYPVLLSQSGYQNTRLYTLSNDIGFYPQPACSGILFRTGGEIGFPQNLVYQKASVEMNFGYYPSGGNRVNANAPYSKTLDRNRWYLLSAPLKKVASGDYSFGGKPFTYMQYFDEINPEIKTYLFGTWSQPFNSYAEELTVGKGFALYVNSHFNDPQFNLASQGSSIPYNQANMNNTYGILTLPYYALDDPNQKSAHPLHTYFNGSSTFRYYDKSDPDKPGNKPADVFFRNATDGGRFVAENSNNQFQTSLSVPYQPARQVLVGNPYMSHIDFAAFYADNADKIQNYYRIWNGVRFFTCQLLADGTSVATNADNIDKYIPPMQSFLVQTKTNEGQPKTQLVFNVNNISAVKGSTSSSVPLNVKKSTTPQNQGLSISARSGDYDSKTLILCDAGADNNYRIGEDVFKLFTQLEEVPEVFTLADDYPLDINHVNVDIETIPLGIICSNYMNPIQLSFKGVGDFDKSIYLYDRIKDKKTLLSEGTEYIFTDNQKNITDRFKIIFSTDPNGVDENAENAPFLIYTHQNRLYVKAPADDKIVQISIYNTQGQCLGQYTNIDSPAFEKDLDIATGNYLVKVIPLKTKTKTELVHIEY